MVLTLGPERAVPVQGNEVTGGVKRGPICSMTLVFDASNFTLGCTYIVEPKRHCYLSLLNFYNEKLLLILGTNSTDDRHMRLIVGRISPHQDLLNLLSLLTRFDSNLTVPAWLTAIGTSTIAS